MAMAPPAWSECELMDEVGNPFLSRPRATTAVLTAVLQMEASCCEAAFLTILLEVRADNVCWEKIRNSRVTVGIKKKKYQV
jgi:hypothetical protein